MFGVKRERPRHRPQLAAGAKQIAKGLDAQLVALDSPNAELGGTQGGRNWSGQIYVATPQLLRAFGIKASQIDPKALVLTSRPGLSRRPVSIIDYSTAAKLGTRAKWLPEVAFAIR